MDPNATPDPHEFAALDAAAWPLANEADTARLRALASDLLPEGADDERDAATVALAFWLVLARTYGFGANVERASLRLALRLQIDDAAALACVDFGQQARAFRVRPGAEPSKPVLQVVCPSPAFLALLHPDS